MDLSLFQCIMNAIGDISSRSEKGVFESLSRVDDPPSLPLPRYLER